MRVLHVCNGMREYDFFFYFFFLPSFILARLPPPPFSPPARACRRPRRADRRRSTCKSSRFLFPSQLKRRRVSPPSRTIIRRFQVGKCNSFRAARRRGSSSIARVSRRCADDASVEAGRLLFFFFSFSSLLSTCRVRNSCGVRDEIRSVLRPACPF